MTAAVVGGLVVSSGRCGSTLLSSLLRRHPAVLSLSEWFSMLGGPVALPTGTMTGPAFRRLLVQLDPDLRDTLELSHVAEVLAQPAMGEVGQLSPLELTAMPHLSEQPAELLAEVLRQGNSQPQQSIGEHFCQLFNWLSERMHRSVWVERSGGSIEYADRLYEAFPGVRQVHLVRDGRDCAVSMAQHPMFRVRLARILARDHALSVRECLSREIPVHRFGAYWSALMHRTKVALAQASGSPKLLVRYESLVASPVAELTRVGEFFSMPQAEHWAVVTASRVQMPPCRWRRLPDVQRSKLERACLPGLRLLERLEPLAG